MTHQHSLILYVFRADRTSHYHRSDFLDQRRIFATWAKVTSILAASAGIGWAFLGFLVLNSQTYRLTGTIYDRLLSIKGMLCGIAIGFLLSIVIARPYRKVEGPKHAAQPNQTARPEANLSSRAVISERNEDAATDTPEKWIESGVLSTARSKESA